MKAVLFAVFLVAIASTTFFLYQRTSDHPTVDPRNILAGTSQAPNQYRVLAPLGYAALRRAGIRHGVADAAVQIASILFCYAAVALLFHRVSGSALLTMIGQLALLGCFAAGMQWKYRQEFFEAGFTSLLMLLAHEPKIRWGPFGLVTLLGSLNRETFVFGLAAAAVELLRKRRTMTVVAGLAALFVLAGAVLAGIRYYYGASPYHTELWMYSLNAESFGRFVVQGNVFYMGGGVLLLYAFTIASGNRAYLPFTIAYAVPYLAVSFAAANWAEHRIFYPLYPVLLAAILRFAAYNSVPCPASPPSHPPARTL